MTEAGLAHLLDALRHNVSVTLVKLCYNHIGGTGRHGNGADVVRRDWTTAASCSSLHADVIRNDEMTSRDGKAADDTRLRYVGSFSDVTSGLSDDVTLRELYSSLREVLHENARLKILLWGNKMNPCFLESPPSRLKT